MYCMRYRHSLTPCATLKVDGKKRPSTRTPTGSTRTEYQVHYLYQVLASCIAKSKVGYIFIPYPQIHARHFVYRQRHNWYKYPTFHSRMISNFFVISPRGDTIIAKDYRSDRGDVGAHERSHTEAFFRKIKFYGQDGDGEDQHPKEKEEAKRKVHAPPVFIMPDGLSYFHVQRNGLIFGCSTARNVSPTTVVQVGSTVLNAIEYEY